jgi:hypothetical protein
MQNKIEDLRNHLFATLEALRDKDNPMEIERAKAISNVANSIIESAKVEVKYIDLVGGSGSGFIPAPTLTGAPALRLAKSKGGGI